MSRIRRISPGLGRGGLLGNTEGPEAYLRELDTLPSQFCRATGGTETVISQGGKFYRVHTFTDTDPTSLLLNFDGANGSTTFTDDSGWGHAVTANGNAAISTTQSKFGGSSLYLDGTGDYLTLNGSSEFAFGSGAFTIEMWFYVTSFPNQYAELYDARPASANGFYPYIYLEDNGVVYFYVNAGNAISSSSGVVSTGQWYHLSVSKSGSSTKMFLDGSQIGSTYSDTNTYLNPASRPVIGGSGFTLGNNPFNGYIDSLRITKGQALYTAAFTPPTQALTRVGSGSLTFTRGGAVEYLVVGGGGGGGTQAGTASGRGNGGGGAGGFRAGVFSLPSQSISVNVGEGGSPSSQGAVSSMLTIESAGGGGGGANLGSGGDGGSGGGGYSNNSPGFPGGSGNTPAVTPSQGNDGGLGISSGGNGGGGGGGGASAVGADAVISPSSAGDGGDGTASTISGSSVTYAGGGGGGSGASTGGGSGGFGGGGTGANTSSKDGTSGTANTGGGGGGASSLSNVGGTGGSGGSGIVIARYRITQAEYEAEAA